MLLNYKMATELKQYALKEGLAIRYALALWSVVRWGVFSVHQEKNGFIRNLSPAEIVQQIVLLKERVNRIVFMGMGEPLFNYDNLI